MSLRKFCSPKTSSISSRTWWTFSSEICTKMLPDDVSRSRATSSRSRRYVRYECSPTSHVSRYALTISGSRVMALSSLCLIAVVKILRVTGCRPSTSAVAAMRGHVTEPGFYCLRFVI